MRAMILGGGGAIGSAIVRYLVRQNIETHAVVRAGRPIDRLGSHSEAVVHRCDVTVSRALADLVTRCEPDLIVNAVSPGGHAHNDEERRELLSGMAQGLLGVFFGVRDAKFKGRLVLLGSGMSYGAGGRPRRTSDPLRAQTFRGAVKAAESGLAAQLSHQFDVALTELRVFTAYGPFEQRERLVPQLLRAALTGTRLRLTAQPFQRDWVHYDDVARACLSATRLETRSAAVFNVCSGVLTSTHNLASTLGRIVGRELIAEETFEGGDCYGDSEPGLLPEPGDGLDWRPETSLQAGLEGCWAWANAQEGSSYLLEHATASA